MTPTLPLGEILGVTAATCMYLNHYLGHSFCHVIASTWHSGAGSHGLLATPHAFHTSWVLERTRGVNEGGCFLPWEQAGGGRSPHPENRSGWQLRAGVAKAATCILNDNLFPSRVWLFDGFLCRQGRPGSLSTAVL